MNATHKDCAATYTKPGGTVEHVCHLAEEHDSGHFCGAPNCNVNWSLEAAYAPAPPSPPVRWQGAMRDAANKSAEADKIERLAQILHEAGRQAVTQGLVYRNDVPVKPFCEWEDLHDAAREGRRSMARFMRSSAVIVRPLLE